MAKSLKKPKKQGKQKKLDSNLQYLFQSELLQILNKIFDKHQDQNFELTFLSLETFNRDPSFTVSEDIGRLNKEICSPNFESQQGNCINVIGSKSSQQRKPENLVKADKMMQTTISAFCGQQSLKENLKLSEYTMINDSMLHFNTDYQISERPANYDGRIPEKLYTAYHFIVILASRLINALITKNFSGLSEDICTEKMYIPDTVDRWLPLTQQSISHIRNFQEIVSVDAQRYVSFIKKQICRYCYSTLLDEFLDQYKARKSIKRKKWIKFKSYFNFGNLTMDYVQLVDVVGCPFRQMYKAKNRNLVPQFQENSIANVINIGAVSQQDSVNLSCNGVRIKYE